MRVPSPVWAHQQSNTQADRRRSPRFKPLAVIPAAFGAPGLRFIGQIANISSSGVSIQFLSESIPPELSQIDGMVDVDFVLGDNYFIVTAKLIRIENNLASFHFEPELPKRVVLMFVEQGLCSAVQWQPGRALVHGSLGIRVLAEVLLATETGRVIDLRHVSQIDNTAIGFALLLQDRRGTLDSCHSNIRDLMSSSGVCSRCAGSCEFSGKRQ